MKGPVRIKAPLVKNTLNFGAFLWFNDIMVDVRKLTKKTYFTVLTGEAGLSNEITSACAGDLLSHIMFKGKKGSVWVTVKTHLNVVAVAVMREFACIIIPDGIKVPDETIEAAESKGIPIIVSEKTEFEICSILYKLGIRP